MFFDILNRIDLKSKNELMVVCKAAEGTARTYPDMCVINIRKALEMLTRSILLENNYCFNNGRNSVRKTLNEMIDLCEQKDSRVNYSIKNRLHKMRIEANKIVHVDYEQEGNNRYQIKDKHTTVMDACQMTIKLYDIIADIFGLDKVELEGIKLPIGDYQIIKALDKNELEGIEGDFKYIAKKTEMGIEQYVYIRPFNRNTEIDNLNRTYFERDASALLRIKSDKFKCSHIVTGNTIKVGDECSLIYVVYDISEDTFTLDQMNKQLSEREELHLIIDITEGLMELKKLKNKMHHRSIRPEYVFITPINDESMEASLGCFETAKIESQEIPIETVMPNMLSTQKNNFFAPVEIRNKTADELKETDWEKVDVYSLAVLLAYCIDKKAVGDSIPVNIFYSQEFTEEFCQFMAQVLQNSLKRKPSLDEFYKMLKNEVEYFE